MAARWQARSRDWCIRNQCGRVIPYFPESPKPLDQDSASCQQPKSEPLHDLQGIHVFIKWLRKLSVPSGFQGWGLRGPAANSQSLRLSVAGASHGSFMKSSGIPCDPCGPEGLFGSTWRVLWLKGCGPEGREARDSARNGASHPRRILGPSTLGQIKERKGKPKSKSAYSFILTEK